VRRSRPLPPMVGTGQCFAQQRFFHCYGVRVRTGADPEKRFAPGSARAAQAGTIVAGPSPSEHLRHGRMMDGYCSSAGQTGKKIATPGSGEVAQNTRPLSFRGQVCLARNLLVASTKQQIPRHNAPLPNDNSCDPLNRPPLPGEATGISNADSRGRTAVHQRWIWSLYFTRKIRKIL